MKKKAVFALSQLPKDEGVPLLIKVARTNTNPEVRKQAMFWLGQSKDPRATDFFAEVLGQMIGILMDPVAHLEADGSAPSRRMRDLPHERRLGIEDEIRASTSHISHADCDNS